MENTWVIRRVGGDYEELGKKYGVSPVVARIMRNRGIMEDSEAEVFLRGGLEILSDGKRLPDCEKLVGLLESAIDEGKHIRVIGDYDVDGVCATAIFYEALRTAGARVDTRIPHRMHDGYGLNERMIREAADAGVEVILTCDNGISASGEVRLAHELGMRVLITDHHSIPVEGLPEAEAVVDPKRSDNKCFFREFCGAAVAWKVAQVLFQKRGIPEEKHPEFFELAALATVADVMPLTGENRVLVREGLKRIRDTKHVGLRSLLEVTDLSGKNLSPYHVGFILGPCINAAGRIDSADGALKLLLEKDPALAHEQAVQLRDLNESRKTMTEKALEKAIKQAEQEDYVNQKILVIFLPDCHESIAGIVAGRVREYFNRPAFILCEGKTSEGTLCLKGSGRSIEAYNMYEGMSDVRELFLQFGGHSQAAGLSILPEKLGEFRQRINEGCSLTAEELRSVVRIDLELPLSYVNLSLAEELELLEPLGTGNEAPLFAARDLSVSGIGIFGKNRNVVKCRLSDGIETRDAVYFGDADSFVNYVNQKGKEPLSVVYGLSVNEYRGERSPQLKIRFFR